MEELTYKELELIATLWENDGQIDMFLMSKEEKKIANTLLQKGYVEKGTAEYDGRFKIFSLTSKGQNAFN